MYVDTTCVCGRRRKKGRQHDRRKEMAGRGETQVTLVPDPVVHRKASEPVPRFYGITHVMRLCSITDRQNVSTRQAPTPDQLDDRFTDGSL